MKIFVAPLQGFTEAPWRNAHNDVFGGVDAYYTPFVRIERGDFRSKDLRDIDPETNSVDKLIPQLIASQPDELVRIVEMFLSKGYQEADLNFGCPFPPITGKHKGSGILPYPDEVKALLDTLTRFPEMKFSVKMRLGLESPDEWRALIQMLNDAPLQMITLHPRVGKQQYRGDVDLNAFKEFYHECSHPLVYNGDILTLDDIRRIEANYPKLEGIMIGRGLLERPSLAVEYWYGRVWTDDELTHKTVVLHDRLFDHYSRTLHGETQIIDKLKPYWEYLLPNLDKKIRRAIKKSTTLAKYQSAIALVR